MNSQSRRPRQSALACGVNLIQCLPGSGGGDSDRLQTTHTGRSLLVFEAVSYLRYSRRAQAFLVPRLVGDCHLWRIQFWNGLTVNLFRTCETARTSSIHRGCSAPSVPDWWPLPRTPIPEPDRTSCRMFPLPPIDSERSHREPGSTPIGRDEGHSLLFCCNESPLTRLRQNESTDTRRRNGGYQKESPGITVRAFTATMVSVESKSSENRETLKKLAIVSVASKPAKRWIRCVIACARFRSLITGQHKGWARLND